MARFRLHIITSLGQHPTPMDQTGAGWLGIAMSSPTQPDALDAELPKLQSSLASLRVLPTQEYRA